MRLRLRLWVLSLIFSGDIGKRQHHLLDCLPVGAMTATLLLLFLDTLLRQVCIGPC